MTTEMVQGNEVAREVEELEGRLDAVLARLARVEQANEETVPGSLVLRLHHGEQPVLVWREYRRLSREDLAEAVGVGSDLIEAIESGKEDVSLRIMSRIAQALNVELDDLVPWPQDESASP